MRKIFSILIIFLSLYGLSVQAQSVDSTHTSEVSDTSGIIIQSPSTYSGANEALQTDVQNLTSTDSTPATSVRLRDGNRGKGIKISSNKPAEHVSVSDSVLRKKHSPTVAGCLSIIPGGGQIYNKKYWKLPIVYGALGISSYFVYDFAHQMVQYKNEFIYRRDGITSKINPDYAIYTDENVLALRSLYRRRMEIAVAVTAILYILNIVDAVVDAHLYYFDISDDLSLQLSPEIAPSNYMASKYNKASYNYGINLTLSFK